MTHSKRPGPRPGPGGGKPKAPKGTLSRLIKYIFDDYKWLLILEIVCILLFALVGVMPSLYVEKIVSIMTEGLEITINETPKAVIMMYSTK